MLHPWPFHLANSTKMWMDNDICFQYHFSLEHSRNTKMLTIRCDKIKIISAAKTRACLGLQQFGRSGREKEGKKRLGAVSPSSSPISRSLNKSNENIRKILTIPLYQGLWTKVMKLKQNENRRKILTIPLYQDLRIKLIYPPYMEISSSSSSSYMEISSST